MNEYNEIIKDLINHAREYGLYSAGNGKTFKGDKHKRGKKKSKGIWEIKFTMIIKPDYTLEIKKNHSHAWVPSHTK